MVEFSVHQPEGVKKPRWKLRESPDEPEYKLWVELAPSGMARCSRGCGELIARKSIRIGEPLRDPRGEDGVISAWKHLQCYRLPKGE